MRVRKVLAFAPLLATAVSILTGCGEQGGDSVVTQDGSGIAGRVHVGPQCPVQTQEHPCADAAAAASRLTVTKQLPWEPETAGEVVARATTNGHGAYRVTVAPGRYVVTTDAGMWCQPMNVRVTAGAFSQVDIRCDTGIR